MAVMRLAKIIRKTIFLHFRCTPSFEKNSNKNNIFCNLWCLGWVVRWGLAILSLHKKHLKILVSKLLVSVVGGG